MAKKQPVKSHPVNFKFPLALIKQIDVICETEEVTRSEASRLQVTTFRV